MNEHVLTAKRTPEIIAGEIRTFTASMLNNIIEIGRRMVEAKELLPYGEFGKWITESTGYSSSTANNFMRLYQEYGADQGSLFGAEVDCQTFGKLSYSKALALLAVPKEERENVAVELDAEHLSTRELERAIRERDEARKQLQDKERELKEAWDSSAAAQDDLERVSQERVELIGKLEAAERRAVEDAGPYKEKIGALEKQVKELESRPVEVAVERDEEAIKKAAAEARTAAEAAAKADMDKLRTRLEKAEKAKEKAEAEAKKAAQESGPELEKAKAEAERARRETDELRRKLASAESGAGEVAMLARMAQTNFAAAMDKIAAMRGAHPDVAGKMLNGMERIVEALGEQVRGMKKE